MSTVPITRRATPLNTEKSLPQNPDVERNVLGAIMLDQSIPNGTLQKVTAIVHSGDFAVPEHGCIFRRMIAIHEEKKPIDLTMLVDEMHKAGEIESIPGGASYLSKLMDGVPHVSNVEHYAQIVLEKSLLRQVIRKTNDIQLLAFEENTSPEKLLTDLESFTRNAAHGRKSGLVAVDVSEFMLMKFDPLEFIIEPLIPLRGSGMIYSPPGLGKTHIALYMAYCVAIGAPTCFVWDIPKRRRVVYVDGEMDAESLQEMVQQIARGLGLEVPDPNYLRIVNPDLQKGTVPRINTVAGRRQIQDLLSPGDMLFLDNLSTLSPGADEDETKDWAPVQEWILELRRNAIATFIVHHANKTGLSQLGSSKKEHQLSCNIKLRRPSDYQMEDGLRVEVLFDKMRNRGTSPFKAKWVQPFEVSMSTVDGKAIFTHRPLKELLRERARQMLADGMKPNDVVLETGLSRWVVARIARGLKWGPNAESGGSAE
jgi:hypothetical protein